MAALKIKPAGSCACDLPSCAMALIGLCLLGCSKQSPSLEPELVRFTEAKRAQANKFVAQHNLRMPAESWRLFDAILADDFKTATNLFLRLERNRFATPPSSPTLFEQALTWGQAGLERIGLRQPKSPGLQSMAWQPLAETYWNYVESKSWHPRFRKMFVNDVLAVVSPKAIYFGGTDPGRFAITAALKSHTNGDPFFVVTQNQLADGSYLDYARAMYSNQIYTPTPDDAQTAFQSYLTDARRRQELGQLKRGENVQVNNNQVHVSGIGAVMEINALLVKVFFDHNSKHDFFIEQSWPLDWSYPRLVPRGPIFKINREPLARLSDDILRADRMFWSNRCAMLIGNWIQDNTTTHEVCDFAERVYVRRDLSEFKGDPEYLADQSAQQCYSKLRYASADLYLWRCANESETAMKQRMLDECMLAFHQALALGPGNYEVVDVFTRMLAEINRFDDAERVIRMSSMINPTNATLMALLEEKKSKPPASK